MDGTDVREQANGTDVAEQQDAASEQELANGLSLMEQFLSDPTHDYKTLKYGDVMEGIIMHLDRDELLVDIGSKAEGIVPAKEYSSLSAEERDKLEVGDNILVFVVQPENNEGHPVVSIDRARQEKSWRKLQEIHEANEVIEAEVTNYNKGGLLVNLDGVRGFVPASQVSEIRGGDESSKQADMARLIGTSLPLKVIEINRHRNRLILSERQAIQERRDVMKERLIEELKEGEIRKGRVSSICDFGAFVDIGGADGLVHLSELSWSRVRHPSEMLKIGQEVDVHVLGINAQEKKIALSIKRTQAEPWSRVATSYEVGKLVRGTVTQVVNFGAFARIEDGIEGLIHVSELADERIQHPKQVVSEGQELLLRIIRIDPQRRRMGLSLRRALDTPDDELVSVFGEGILEERDALVAKIREALEAEGLTGQFAEPRDEEGEGTSSEGTAAAAAPAPEVRIDPVAAFEERQQRAEEAAAARRESRGGSRGQTRQQEATSAFEGEEMSAMAMAFALAGAADGILTEEPSAAATEGETPATAEATSEVEAPSEVVETTPAAESVPEIETQDAPVADETAAATDTAETDAPSEVAATAEAEPTAAEDDSGAATSKSVNEKLPSTGEGTAWVAGDGTQTVPAGFPIKGNASSRIYHPEASPSYSNTVAEIYFATEADAEAEGYRLPKNMQRTGSAAAEAAESVAEAAADKADTE
jgi:small subunit ribosomal protein S1